ncbi:MAG: large subunit ribosomal protein L29 [Planctomycetota bacterium]|jgi:large subunit ribosomal protein L29
MAISKEDIKELSPSDLIEKVLDTKLILKKIEFNNVISPVDNPLVIRSLRRDIAKLKTEIRRRELETSEN